MNRGGARSGASAGTGLIHGSPTNAWSRCAGALRRRKPTRGVFRPNFGCEFDRKRYEEASGVLAIPDSEARLSGLVLVWALVDAGFQLFFSEPLTLGSLDPAKIGRGRARP